MRATNEPLDLWKLAPLVAPDTVAVDSLAELMLIEGEWLRTLMDRARQRNEGTIPLPEVVVMIEHWKRQTALLETLDARGLVTDREVCARVKRAFQSQITLCETFKSALEELDEKTRAVDETSRALELAQREATRCETAIAYAKSNAAHNLARLERRAEETAAAVTFWSACEVEALATLEA